MFVSIRPLLGLLIELFGQHRGWGQGLKVKTKTQISPQSIRVWCLKVKEHLLKHEFDSVSQCDTLGSFGPKKPTNHPNFAEFSVPSQL